jgi:hypothetical protein
MRSAGVPGDPSCAAAEALLALCFVDEARCMLVNLPGAVLAIAQLAAEGGGGSSRGDIQQILFTPELSQS